MDNPEIRCEVCGRIYDYLDMDAVLWVSIGPDGVSLDEQIIYCPEHAEQAT